ncbi:TetR/AcrR family transcriptional repressor of nem operon [Bosea sp. OAE752]
MIETASRLFREHGFDGIGLKDLMAGAGLTQGGFYKQFASKDELTALASRRAIASSAERWSSAAASRPDDPLSAVAEFYLSPEHVAERAEGCAFVALASDAARQGPEVKAEFEAGIRANLDMIASLSGEENSDALLAKLSMMVGAVLLSRTVNDETLARRILNAAGSQLDGHTKTTKGAQ